MTAAKDGGAVIVGNASVIFFVVMAKWHDLDQDICREHHRDGLYSAIFAHNSIKELRMCLPRLHSRDQLLSK